jgi:methionyl-tRNA formyltransferase
MGTPDFAVPPLEALVRAGYTVRAVVTQPDKPKGRGKTLLPTPVKETALKYEIPVFQPKKVRDPEFVELLKEQKPDLIVVAAFGQIIPQVILDLPEYGCINIHASLLPKYRGAAPIQQAILDGEKETGVTIMRMGMGLDTGDMISRIATPITEEETGGSLFDKLAALGADLLLETIPHMIDGTVRYEKQPEESPTPYAAMITKERGAMDFTRSATELERLVRGLNPWPSAYTFLNGKNLKIWKCTALTEDSGAAPGVIYKTDKAGIYVACGEGSLLLTELQLEGKKRMDAGAFLRGYSIENGTKLMDHRGE